MSSFVCKHFMRTYFPFSGQTSDVFTNCCITYHYNCTQFCCENRKYVLIKCLTFFFFSKTLKMFSLRTQGKHWRKYILHPFGRHWKLSCPHPGDHAFKDKLISPFSCASLSGLSFFSMAPQNDRSGTCGGGRGRRFSTPIPTCTCTWMCGMN